LYQKNTWSITAQNLTRRKNNMKILVTGAKGQLGKKIIDILGKDHQLVLTDFDNMDITDIDIVKKVVEKEKPDYIIHAAAYTAVDKAEENVELCRKINAIGAKNVATVAKEYDIKLIYISTDYVFDGKKNTPYSESDEPKPISVYGLTKYEGEEFIRKICDKYYIIRVAGLFGELPAEHTGTNFVEAMLRLAGEKPNLNVVNDQIGSPTYTGDLAEIIAKIMTKTPEINVDLKPITSNQYPQKAKRPRYSYLNKSKIENVLSIKARPWQKMLAEYLSNRKNENY